MAKIGTANLLIFAMILGIDILENGNTIEFCDEIIGDTIKNPLFDCYTYGPGTKSAARQQVQQNGAAGPVPVQATIQAE